MPAPNPFLLTYDRGSQNFFITAASGNLALVGANGQPVGVTGYGISPSLSRAMIPSILALQIDTNGSGALTSATVQLLGSLDGVKWAPIGSPVALAGGNLSAGSSQIVSFTGYPVRYVCVSVTNFVVASGAPTLGISFSM